MILVKVDSSTGNIKSCVLNSCFVEYVSMAGSDLQREECTDFTQLNFLN